MTQSKVKGVVDLNDVTSVLIPKKNGACVVRVCCARVLCVCCAYMRVFVRVFVFALPPTASLFSLFVRFCTYIYFILQTEVLMSF